MTSQAVVPLADPGAQYLALRGEIDAAITEVLHSGFYVLGPQVSAFEREFANYIGASQAIGVANGTDAIALALRALDIGCGDEVITVAHTAVATVAAIEQVGATPVLVDVEAGLLTMDPAQLAEATTPRTRAVIPVHLYGQAASIDAIERFCSEHELALIEDASQAHGATWDGRRLGSIGLIGVFSCYPTKNLGALGDAGVIVTSDLAIAERLRALRQYGWVDRNNSLEPGVNSRLDELQAAVLRVKLRQLDHHNDRRRELADAYDAALADLPVKTPTRNARGDHVFHLYVVEVSDRERVRTYLSQRGIQTVVHYPIPVHLQPAYLGRIRTANELPVTVAASERILSLPIFPELTDNMQSRVIRAITEAVGAKSAPVLNNSR